ncbi:MAG: NTP transferase domain-containing protein, partial [Candidatus Eremiobacteraeota bacterium]|nr:NTP transferase domain-containing protein [Candidatus Eremiobacteraeota bacterium]
MKITTVVLAGGTPDEVAACEPGAINKAFVRIAGVPLVTRTLRALRAAPSVGRIICVTPAAAHDSPALDLADERRADGARISQSLWNGLRDLPPDDPVFVSASDLPILSTACIESFLEGAVRADVDLAYAILERAPHMREYPQIPHTWARLADGTYCGGGFITLRPRTWPLLARFIERLGA